MGTKRLKAKSREPPPRVAEESELPERWSAQGKTELVLRLLRGEETTQSLDHGVRRSMEIEQFGGGC